MVVGAAGAPSFLSALLASFMLKKGEDHTFTKRRRIIQHTKKMGCPAEINVLHIIRYPDFKLANLPEKVDRRVQQKVISLHRDGVRKINEIMRHINAFVTQELFPGDDPPVALRRRFYPTRKDLANLMFKAKHKGRNSSFDRENVLNLLKEWKELLKNGKNH